jgi:death-on-curing protein
VSEENSLEFLSREVVDAIQEDRINSRGGIHGRRNENGLESAIAQPQNVHHYGGGDLYEIAAAYTFHLSAKPTSTGTSGLVRKLQWFMEGNGIDTSPLT